MFSKTVADPGQLKDTDLISIDNTEMQVGMARELGLLRKAFPEDAGLNAGAAAMAAEVHREATPEVKVPTGTGNDTYDEAVKGLSEAVETGIMDTAEAHTYDTAVAQVAMAGMTTEMALAVIEGGTEGVSGEDRAMLQQVQQDVERSATQSAMSELGRDGFETLKKIAQVDPEVSEAIRGYAAMRALGKTNGLTWRNLLADVLEDQKRGG
ncbi:MAG: hypothetical protein P8N68_12000 [Paracoccaceae bacterium]|nr:hypothetical protein [Paracoccaceae bacterium]